MKDAPEYLTSTAVASVLSMKYQVVVEYDPPGKYYTATVPGMPIVVESRTERGALKLAREAIQIHREKVAKSRPPISEEPPVRAKVVTVDV